MFQHVQHVETTGRCPQQSAITSCLQPCGFLQDGSISTSSVVAVVPVKGIGSQPGRNGWLYNRPGAHRHMYIYMCIYIYIYFIVNVCTHIEVYTYAYVYTYLY